MAEETKEEKASRAVKRPAGCGRLEEKSVRDLKTGYAPLAINQPATSVEHARELYKCCNCSSATRRSDTMG